MEATHVPINTLLDKEDMEYIYPTLHIYASVYTHTHTHTHTLEYYSAINSEILSFVAMWMGLKNITLNKINQREKDKYYIVSLIREI